MTVLKDKMPNFVFLLLLGIHSTAAVSHSLKYIFTASSRVPNFPEFVAVGLVDDVQMMVYDSNTEKAVPIQDWSKKIGQWYWDRDTTIGLAEQHRRITDIEIYKQRFNQTAGVHIVQRIYGCEWDDETQQVTGGFEQHGYDGEDLIILNRETNTYIAAKQQAVMTKNTWNNDRVRMETTKNYFNHVCPGFLKQFVGHGRNFLMRTDLPLVYFLQKSSSSPVSCFATGFYPSRAEMFWRKNGEEIHDGVEKDEVKPNNDGTFQMSVDIDLSSVAPEDWPKYECVFQLSGVSEDLTIRLEKTGILTNESNTNNGNILLAALAVLGVFGFIGLIGGIIAFILSKKNKAVVNGQPHEEMRCLQNPEIAQTDQHQEVHQ